MPILQIEHAVRDYDAWKKAFDSDPVGREQGGVPLRQRGIRNAGSPLRLEHVERREARF